MVKKKADGKKKRISHEKKKKLVEGVLKHEISIPIEKEEKLEEVTKIEEEKEIKKPEEPIKPEERAEVKESKLKKKVEVQEVEKEKVIPTWKSKEVLESIGKGLHTGVEGIKRGAQVAVKSTKGISERMRRGITVAKLKYTISTLRKKIRETYNEIGGEVCALEAEEKKTVEIEKGKMKKLIDQVKKYEANMQKIEKELENLQS